MSAWLDLLPHGPAFRFVDAVDACTPGHSVTARWRPTGREPWAPAHFPGRSLVPAVLQVEALAQAGAIALLADPDRRGRLPLFGGAEGLRFRRPVHPGEELLLEVELEHVGGLGGWGRGRASVDGAETASGRLLFVVAPPG